MNYHIVDERHSIDDHVGRVGNDDAKDDDISTTRRQNSKFSSNIESYYYDVNNRNIVDTDRFNDILEGVVDDNDDAEDDSNDNVDLCKVDKLRPQISIDIVINQLITTDEILRYNLRSLNKNEPETPPSSLL